MLAGLTPSACSALAHDVGVAVREVQAIRLSDAEMGIGWPWLGTSDELEARAEEVSDNALGNIEKSVSRRRRGRSGRDCWGRFRRDCWIAADSRCSGYHCDPYNQRHQYCLKDC
ncbi:hypothetical protein CDV31_016501 [Fusarium ambrosium]|uniref:Uncharacterized protein n=1 Tax=Fusarium ambrosium TaxID=131363 RepID=A0A428S7L9_9HYPO|nr:hypothetical protein CDV31_016501 [Fusarium ambrosium]